MAICYVISLKSNSSRTTLWYEAYQTLTVCEGVGVARLYDWDLWSLELCQSTITLASDSVSECHESDVPWFLEVKTIYLLVCKKFKLSLKSCTNLKGGSLWWLKMLEKKSDFVNICGHFLGKYYCNEHRQYYFSKYMLLWSLWHSFSRSQSFYHMSTPYCSSVPFYHHVSHNCKQIYTWKPYKFTLLI